jgi:hypothetical protein
VGKEKSRETMTIPVAVAKWIEDNGYMLKLSSRVWFDVLSEEIYIKRRDQFYRAKITPAMAPRR